MQQHVSHLVPTSNDSIGQTCPVQQNRKRSCRRGVDVIRRRQRRKLKRCDIEVQLLGAGPINTFPVEKKKKKIPGSQDVIGPHRTLLHGRLLCG